MERKNRIAAEGNKHLLREIDRAASIRKKVGE
jgi:hypothetical protein